MKLSLLFPSAAAAVVTSMKLGLVFPDHEPGRSPAHDDAPPSP